FVQPVTFGFRRRDLGVHPIEGGSRCRDCLCCHPCCGNGSLEFSFGPLELVSGCRDLLLSLGEPTLRDDVRALVGWVLGVWGLRVVTMVCPGRTGAVVNGSQVGSP